MRLAYDILLFLHLVGWAIVLGGTIVTLREARLPKGALHGILTALVTGIAMVGLAQASDELRDPNNAKIAVKLVIALVVTGLIVYGTRRPEKVTRGLAGAILGLTVVNVAVAAIWR
ncbi:hypothetical protein [Cellulomonas alba]|uniref:Integral membrane protein n=1 Tax=Cellulomonas alba TaxID=3053467 RepID=A0ABT7SDV7_9CELL|nr:hypothetical protein [Cellulomonas alba]MDM7854239.1 hypothetical protein [Cellulomonas alba]